MQVLYVDVYFLINFTVDTVALFISVKLLHVKSDLWRILLASAVGSLVALACVLYGELTRLLPIIGVSFFLFLAIIVSKQLSVMRRLKFVVIFLFLEMAIGGIVNYAYILLDRYFGDIGEYFDEGETNRKALIFSVIILLAIGVLKLFIMLFSEQTKIKSTRIMIRIGSAKVECDALVDSGNLARDPMNMNPVVFVRRSIAEKLLPTEIIELSNIDRLDYSLQKKIRLIPISRGGATHVMTGFIPDEVRCTDREGESLAITLAIDKEDGTYGGHDAILPSCILGI